MGDDVNVNNNNKNSNNSSNTSELCGVFNGKSISGILLDDCFLKHLIKLPGLGIPELKWAARDKTPPKTMF